LMSDTEKRRGPSFAGGPFGEHVWQSLMISAIGFVLVNASFILDFLWHNSVTLAIMQITGSDPNELYAWYPHALKVSFLLLVLLASYFALTSKLSTVIKAAFSTVPVVSLLLAVGAFFAGSSTYATLSGTAIVAGILYWLSRHDMPWQYIFSVLLAGICSLAFIVAGM